MISTWLFGCAHSRFYSVICLSAYHFRSGAILYEQTKIETNQTTYFPNHPHSFLWGFENTTEHNFSCSYCVDIENYLPWKAEFVALFCTWFFVRGVLTSSTPTATPVWSRRCAHTNLAMSTLVWPVGVELVRTLLSMLGDAFWNFIKHNIRAARVSFCVISTLLEGCWVFYYGSWPQKFRCTTHSARFGFTTVIFYNVLTNHELYFSVQKDMTILYLSIILKASFSEGFLASQNKECCNQAALAMNAG